MTMQVIYNIIYVKSKSLKKKKITYIMKCDEKTNGNQVYFRNISIIFYRAYQTRMIVLKFLSAYIIFNI